MRTYPTSYTLKAVVIADPSYHDICPMIQLENGQLQQADGLYGLDAYGQDSGQVIRDDQETDGELLFGDVTNTFYDTAMAEIYEALEVGKHKGLTSNGVAWAVTDNAEFNPNR